MCQNENEGAAVNNSAFYAHGGDRNGSKKWCLHDVKQADVGWKNG